jgi:hypothetical protein
MEEKEKGLSRLVEKTIREAEDKENLFSKLRRLNVGDRLKLAQHGNREIRTVLIRDSTKSVQMAVLSNPRITDGEIAQIASSKTVDDDVIRLILNHREWVKNYGVKLALVKNPRTPVKASMRFLAHLRDRDLRELSRNKSIPQILTVHARSIISSRTK